MGHNIHFICVWASSGPDAIRQADRYLQEWGDEDNWRSFIRAVCKDGTVFENDDQNAERWGAATLADINAEMQEVVGDGGRLRAALHLAKKLVKAGRLSSSDWFDLHDAAENMYYVVNARKNVGRGKFDVFKTQYKYGMYDETGVTHFYNGHTDADPNRKVKKWCVVMGMHS